MHLALRRHYKIATGVIQTYVGETPNSNSLEVKVTQLHLCYFQNINIT